MTSQGCQRRTSQGDLDFCQRSFFFKFPKLPYSIFHTDKMRKITEAICSLKNKITLLTAALKWFITLAFWPFGQLLGTPLFYVEWCWAVVSRCLPEALVYHDALGLNWIFFFIKAHQPTAGHCLFNLPKCTECQQGDIFFLPPLPSTSLLHFLHGGSAKINQIIFHSTFNIYT